MSAQIDTETLCRECERAYELRQGWEDTGYCDVCAQGMVQDALRYRALRDNEKVRARAYERDGYYDIVELKRGAVLDESIDAALHAIDTGRKP